MRALSWCAYAHQAFITLVLKIHFVVNILFCIYLIEYLALQVSLDFPFFYSLMLSINAVL